VTSEDVSGPKYTALPGAKFSPEIVTLEPPPADTVVGEREVTTGPPGVCTALVVGDVAVAAPVPDENEPVLTLRVWLLRVEGPSEVPIRVPDDLPTAGAAMLNLEVALPSDATADLDESRVIRAVSTQSAIKRMVGRFRRT
jgi:hypothetical protein